MITNLKKLFEKHDEEYMKFDRVPEKLSQRPDIHAFILLDRICPQPGRDIVSASEHDEIWLSMNVDDFYKVATEEDVIELIRCGVRWHDQYDSLFIFV